MFMPMKPIIAPFLFPAAVFIASACACTMCAAAMLVLRKTADFCSSLMVASSSAEAVTELTPTATMARPRVSPHLLDRTSFMACASSSWLSSAAFSPISGFAPAPSPFVSFSPICMAVGALQNWSACLSVLIPMNSTPRIFSSTMRFTALFPAPPTPITRILAAFSASFIFISNKNVSSF